MSGALIFGVWPEWDLAESHTRPALLLAAWAAGHPSLDDADVFRDALADAYTGRNANMGGDLRAREWLRLFVRRASSGNSRRRR